MSNLVMEDAPEEGGDWLLSPTGAVYRATENNSRNKNSRLISAAEAARRLKAQGADLEKLGLKETKKRGRPKKVETPPEEPSAEDTTALDDQLSLLDDPQ